MWCLAGCQLIPLELGKKGFWQHRLPQHSPTWEPGSQTSSVSVAINCHQGEGGHLSGTLFTELGNEEAGRKRSLIHSSFWRGWMKWQEPSIFFTGGVKEGKCMQLHAASGALVPLKVWHFPSSLSCWWSLKHLPLACALPISAQIRWADLSLSPWISPSLPQTSLAGAQDPTAHPGLQVRGSKGARPARVSLGRTRARVQEQHSWFQLTYSLWALSVRRASGKVFREIL